MRITTLSDDVLHSISASASSLTHMLSLGVISFIPMSSTPTLMVTIIPAFRIPSTYLFFLDSGLRVSIAC